MRKNLSIPLNSWGLITEVLKFVVFQTENGKVNIDVFFDKDTL